MRKEELRWTRIMVVVIGLVSVAIALLAGTIYKLAMVAWSLLLVGLFAPYALGMYWQKANRSGAIAAFLGGFAAWLVGILAYFPQMIEACEADFECGLWDTIYISFEAEESE
ncbi:MAG: sodium:solute symporter family transporter [Anaerolineae bacterium]